MKKNFLPIILALSLSACTGGKTLDTTNMQTFESSMNAMVDELEGEKKAKFQEAVLLIGVGLMSAGLNGAFKGKDSAQSEQEFLKQFDGLNADEVIDKVNKLSKK